MTNPNTNSQEGRSTDSPQLRLSSLTLVRRSSKMATLLRADKVIE
jgi:hypothetical protein